MNLWGSAQRRGRAQAREHTLPARQARHAGGNEPSRCCRGLLGLGPPVRSRGCKPPPLFMREASSCPSQARRQGEPWGASPRPSAPTYLPVSAKINVTQLAQPLVAPRGDRKLVDLPLWDVYLSDHVLASVFSTFYLSSAYPRFVAEGAWPIADDTIFATPSMLNVTARWASQRIILMFGSASCKALHFGDTIPLCALANEGPLPSPVKREQVAVSVYKLLASVWARHRLGTLEVPKPPNFRQDWGMEISGGD